jgi:hypothetical protein
MGTPTKTTLLPSREIGVDNVVTRRHTFAAGFGRWVDVHGCYVHLPTLHLTFLAALRSRSLKNRTLPSELHLSHLGDGSAEVSNRALEKGVDDLIIDATEHGSASAL